MLLKDPERVRVQGKGRAQAPAAPGARALTFTSVVWPFIAGMGIVMVFGFFSINTLSALRSYSLGENLWIKNQKNATLQLIRYTYTNDQESLVSFDDSIRFSRAFRDARRALTASPMRVKDLHEIGRESGLTEREVDNAMWLRAYFGDSEFVSSLFEIWRQADVLLERLDDIRAEIDERGPAGTLLPAQRAGIIERTLEIDRSFAPLSHRFSSRLSAMSVDVSSTLKGIGALIGLFMTIAIVLRTWQLMQSRQTIEQTLSNERQRAAVTLSSIGDAVVSTDEDGRVQFMNTAAERLCMLSPGSVLGGPMGQGPHIDDVIRLVDERSGQLHPSLLALLRHGTCQDLHGNTEQLLLRRDGSRVPVSWVASPIRDASSVSGVVLVLRETTRERQLIERLSWLAAHDPLTALPNRREFERHLGDALASGDAAEGADPALPDANPALAPFAALLVIDLDQFKIVNDTCGHAAGDELLRQVGTAIHASLDEGEVVARMGGDEFGVLLRGTAGASPMQRAQALRGVIAGVSLQWGLRQFGSTASIGLLRIDNFEGSMGEALSAADVACYMAKEKGRNRVELFASDDLIQAGRLHEMAWTQRLQAAIREQRLQLFEQRLLALQPSRDDPPRVELLLRLRDEQGEIVTPQAFLPAADRFGLMPQIDRWVVENALHRIGARRRAGTLDPRLLYCINLSGSSIGDAAFVRHVKHCFEREGVPHHQVCFEITESQAVANLDGAVLLMNELRALGCSFALDDFGVGMSSFTYLKSLPVSTLKIDGAFVRNMIGDPVDRTIVEIAHALAAVLGMQTVGEFAGTPEIVEALRGCGVHYAQGYAVSLPAPLDEGTAHA